MKHNNTKGYIYKLCITIMLALNTVSIHAQAPLAIPYQAVARDSTGNLISNQNISLRFGIYQTAVGGMVIYQEIRNVTTNSLGWFSAIIGQGMVTFGTFASINWNSGEKYVQVELDASGGSNYTDMGRTQMLSVPYALSSGSSTNSWNLNGNIGTNSTNNFIGTSDNVPLNFRVNNEKAGGIDQVKNNSSIGYKSLYSNTNGNYNSANGNNALYSNLTGSYNTANGFYSLYANTTGFYNTAIGSYALNANLTGHFNTAIGLNALVMDSSGSTNTAVGANAGLTNTSGSGNVFLGYNAGYYETGSNKLYIANGGASPLIYGDFSTNKIGLGTTTPEFRLSLDSDGGIMATGTLGSGTLLTTAGSGTRLFWYPRKAAFRAGIVFGPEWDDANIGDYSFATNIGTKASGTASIATGAFTVASGNISTAMGWSTTASAESSTAMGLSTIASGDYSTAIGVSSTASGYASMAVGNYASTNFKTGAFVMGDNGTSTIMNSSADNQFSARFINGYRLFTNSTLTSGVTLAAGAGAWASVSDKNLKENFREVNTEDILAKVGAIPVTDWNYKTQDKKVRHIGPMAQDFFAAFHLDGESDTTINTLDIDGINMAAIQALKQRTDELKKATNKIDAMQTEIETLKSENSSFKNDIANIKALIGLEAKTGN